jgi:GDP-4-dehydro-6-deoxy-D-mannose reductase
MPASPRVLVTGCSGFVGQWLSRSLLARGAKVFGGTIEGAPAGAVLTEDEKRAICWLQLDVLSDEDVARAIERSAPDWVVHLAGIAYPPEANASPVRALEVNALGAARLLWTLAARAADSAARVLVVGSAEQYGPHPASEYPLTEKVSAEPLTAYAASKAAQELVALQIFRRHGLPVICTRSFNHSGPGHGANYLLPSLVRRALELPDSGGSLRIGNSTSQRDFLHVQDVVDAYVLLLERGEPGEVYNVASGRAMTIREIARRVLDRARKSADISIDPALLRPTDMPMLVGDSTKLRQATGWQPRHSIDDIIDDLIHAATR